MEEQKYFACNKCGQVYHDKSPEKCIRLRVPLLYPYFGKIIPCDSDDFEEIAKDDVLDMHDALPFILNLWAEKFKTIFKIK